MEFAAACYDLICSRMPKPFPSITVERCDVAHHAGPLVKQALAYVDRMMLLIAAAARDVLGKKRLDKLDDTMLYVRGSLGNIVTLVQTDSRDLFGWVGMRNAYVNMTALNATAVFLVASRQEVHELTLDQTRRSYELRIANLERALAQQLHPEQPTLDPPSAMPALVPPALDPRSFALAVTIGHELTHLVVRLALGDGNFHTPNNTLQPEEFEAFAPGIPVVDEAGSHFENLLLGGVTNFLLPVSDTFYTDGYAILHGEQSGISSSQKPLLPGYGVALYSPDYGNGAKFALPGWR